MYFGLGVGLLFGYILQRGRLCFNSAIRDVKFFGDNYLMKAIFLAISINSLVFVAMAQFGLIQLHPLAFAPLGNILGGLIFGFGMVLAGGCASGVTYRTGEGMISAWIAALFYAIFASASKASFLKPLISLLKGPVYTVEGDGKYYAYDAVGPTIATVLKVNPWIPAIIFAVIVWYILWKTKTTERPDSAWNWKLLGILTVIVSALGYLTKQTYGLGITGGWVSLMNYLIGGKYIGWSGMFILGIIFGSLVSALIRKEFKFRAPRDPKVFGQVALGGILMGFGAVLAGGCNIGHFLTGFSHLAIGSILTTIFFFLGNWAGYYWLYERD
ncbi:transporter [Marinitoga sp. 1137]|nr:transporter [Marinitoga sp. 1137]